MLSNKAQRTFDTHAIFQNFPANVMMIVGTFSPFNNIMFYWLLANSTANFSTRRRYSSFLCHDHQR